MYQSIECEIGPDGVVTLHEAIHPAGRFLAIMTILHPISELGHLATQPTLVDRLWSHRTRVAAPIQPLSRDDANRRQ